MPCPGPDGDSPAAGSGHRLAASLLALRVESSSSAPRQRRSAPVRGLTNSDSAKRSSAPTWVSAAIHRFLLERVVPAGRAVAPRTWRQVGCRHDVDEQGGAISVEPRINDRIRVPEVRLVGPNGEQVGIVRIEDALRRAVEADLDLVEVAPMAKPPVCKLMDFGKFKYEAAMKERESRRNQTHTIIKEMKLRPKIDSHDYETKKGHVERFLRAGDKVKITIMFRGREQSRPELGLRLLARLADDVVDLGFVEATPKQDGRNMIMVLAPHRRKGEGPRPREAELQALDGVDA